MTDISSGDNANGKSTLTFEEIMEVLEEELANSQLEDTDDLSPLNFDEINSK